MLNKSLTLNYKKQTDNSTEYWHTVTMKEVRRAYKPLMADCTNYTYLQTDI